MWHIQALGYYLAIKKEENPAISNNMDRPGGRYVK
jgi:hypothetical protein